LPRSKRVLIVLACRVLALGAGVENAVVDAHLQREQAGVDRDRKRDRRLDALVDGELATGMRSISMAISTTCGAEVGPPRISLTYSTSRSASAAPRYFPGSALWTSRMRAGSVGTVKRIGRWEKKNSDPRSARTTRPSRTLEKLKAKAK
jgi:hypothetical protein